MFLHHKVLFPGNKFLKIEKIASGKKFLKKISCGKRAHFFGSERKRSAPFFSERERNFATERVQI
jgi:hypothetical protein